MKKMPSARRPWVVAALTDHGRLMSQSLRAAQDGAHLLEIRVDAFPAAALRIPTALRWTLLTVRRAARRPLLLTIRFKREGGKWKSSEARRLELYRELLPIVDGVDVEGASPIAGRVLAAAKAAGKWTLLSHHDFRRTPDDAALRRMGKAFERSGADVFKVAAMPGSAADVDRLMDFCAGWKGRRAFIAMGPLGVQTRLTPGRWGSCLTYGFVGKSAAPGQVSVETLARKIR